MSIYHLLQTVDVHKLEMYIYQLHEVSEEMEQLDSEDEVIAASHWLLPSAEFHGLWQSLIYDNNIKNSVTR